MPKESKKSKKFVFNDESQKNSYGFTIPTKGISLKRFRKNPVMLDSHWNSTHNVLGSWEKIEVNQGLLTGEPVFDSEDENATYIKGKVDRGFIKSCSMGVSFNREDLKIVDGELVLTKCELMEVSIVAVPSNANAIRLYAAETEELLTDEEVQNLCLSIKPTDLDTNIPNNKNVNMNKIKLSAKAAAVLSLSEGAEIEPEVLQQKLCDVAAQRDAANLQLSALKQQEEQKKLTAIQNKVELAVKQGKVTAENKDKFIELGVANPDLLDQTLQAIPVKKSLAGTLTNPKESETGEVKTADDFQKLSVEEQLKFKAEHPNQYIKLFTKLK